MEDTTFLEEKLIEEEKADLPVVESEPMEISDEALNAESELQKIAPVKENEVLKTKSPSKKWLIAFLFLAVNLISILVTAIMEFTGEEAPINISEVWGTFRENWIWGAGAIGLVLLTIIFEGAKRFVLLRTTLKKNLPWASLGAVIICKYYDNVTPLGAGGQPFEIYYLRKKGLPIGIASSVPLVSYSLNKIAYVLVSFLFILIYGYGDVSRIIQVLCMIGLIVNTLIPIAIIMFAFMPKFSSAIARFVAKVGKLLHLVKDQEEFYKNITGSFIEYGECINYFVKKSKLSILISFLCSAGYYLALYSLPYFTIRLSGNTNADWGQMITYCIICYASITLLPTPGNAGGAELSFRSIFESYLSGGILFWGMLSWRILSYYVFIIFGFVLLIIQHTQRIIKEGVFKKKHKQPSVKVEPEDELEPYSPIPPTVPTAEADINTAYPVAVATLEPEVEPIIEPEEIIPPSASAEFESVVEFTAVIESKSTVTITDEHIEVNDNVEEVHQISLDELVHDGEQVQSEPENTPDTAENPDSSEESSNKVITAKESENQQPITTENGDESNEDPID